MAADCRAQIERDGLIVQTRSGIRDHPLIRTLIMSQSFMTRSLIRLGAVDVPKPVMGRPSGRGNLGVGDAYTVNGKDYDRP